MKQCPPVIPSIKYSTIRDTGRSISCTFAFTKGREAIQLATILSHLAVNDVLGTPLPDADGGLEVRRTRDGYEKKVGRHGCHGTWTATTASEAVDWLLPGAVYAVKFAGHGYGGTIEFHKG